MNLEIRENGNGTLNTCQTQPEPTHLEEHGGRDSFKNIDKPSSYDKFSFTSRSSSLEKQEEGNDDDQVGLFNNTLEDVRSIIDGDESNCDENVVHSGNVSLVSTFESDPRIWKPPAPADIEDDMDSVANNDDDDDEYGDGTKWGQPSYLSGFDAENGNSLKEEREKAIMEAMNGQFKMLVSRFLASEDISNDGNPGERWLDIIASLSWEAALLIKPEANEGRAMDPVSYVKVKCIASGARTESQVVKGLVFKKNTAHKRMPTKLKNPRLLLLQGNLGQREVGLSSFDLMKEEDNYLKSINDMLKACHPNVVLVEKSVSRDIQEFLLKEGMTLVFDMKLTRLNRISRCIGSPIISATEVPTNPMVKQCDSFYIEKFVEEHNNNEAGKKPNKTLMFLEGFPKPLGCTIILKGAPIDELKKVKRVVQYTVFAAYHLILEISFFADQRASFSDTHLEANGCLKDKSDTLDCCNDATDLNTSLIDGNLDGTVQPYNSNVPSSNGSLENSTHESMYSGSNFMSNENNQADLGYDKPNGDTVMEAEALTRLEWMPSFSSSLKKFLSDSYTPINSEFFSSYFDFNMEELDTESVSGFPVTPSLEGYEHETEVNGHDDISSYEKPDPLSNPNVSIENDTTDKIENERKNTIESVLEPQSILILRSSQCITKGVVCEQSHLYRIKYYGDLDVSLGRFLRDTLLKQKHTCTSCGEPPKAHVYCYTHQNGNLTIAVRQLPTALSLSGESEGKIWMWTRCLKCEHENGIPRSTPRVVMSRAARNFSFGKFLELSFSRHSLASRVSSKCGHSLDRDCLRFFGLGSNVAMFRYSSVEIYAPCKPPPVLELHNPTAQEWVKKEAKSVLRKGDMFFLEVANLLEKLKRGDFGVFQMNPKNCMRRVKDLREVEEMLIQEKTEFEDSLLKAINFSGQLGKAINDILSFSWLIEELRFELYIWDSRLHSLLQCIKDKDVSHDDTEEQPVEKTMDSPAMDLQSSIENPTQSEESSSVHITHAQNVASLESEMEASIADTSLVSEIADSSSSTGEKETNLAEHVQSVAESELKAYDTDNGDSVNSNLDGPNDWVWAPFSELRRTYRNDLYDGVLHKFEYIRSFLPKYLSPIKLNPQENNSLHFPIGADGNVISLCEDEISSVIACALLLSEESADEKDAGEADRPVDNSNSLSSEGSVSSYWSSTGSVEFEGIHPSRSFSSHSFGDLSTSGTETSEILHPEIIVTSGKGSGRSRYSVVFIHAKQFYALRRMCCPSELAYISSLSRCKKWDAQGGKSKAFFAKTLDDRFIIKQIKKTETECFLKFAPEYFRHISHSISSGSQTCLAKIFGIYQVRQNRGGKEVKIDLMVMENLLYGRNFTRTYDLKGAVFSRYIDAGGPEAVLLDENFVEDMRVSPMYIAGRNKHLFQRAIWNDTAFLTSINVMDYSLLVGVDKQRHELVFGIIDYVRQYTWDKQLETWVKSSLVVPKNSLPTVISPKEYKKRFRKFMSKYFLTVPATWTSEQCSGPCKFCNDPCKFCNNGTTTTTTTTTTRSSSFEKTTIVSNT